MPRAGRWLLETVRPFLPNPKLLFLVVLLAFGVWGAWRAVRSLDAFRIVQVEVDSASPITLPQPSLVGANLWEVDVHALAASIAARYPWFERVDVVRMIPNTLRICPIERVPVAQVRTEGWRMIDRFGVISPVSSSMPYVGLIRLIGVTRSPRTKEGGPDQAWTRILRVLDALRAGPPSVVRRVTEVTVVDPQAIRLLLDDMTDVRCGSDAELPIQLNRLDAALQFIARQPIPIRAVDVRFTEPVITPAPPPSSR